MAPRVQSEVRPFDPVELVEDTWKEDKVPHGAPNHARASGVAESCVATALHHTETLVFSTFVNLQR